MIETGRIIQRRYLLQRLIQQGQCCAIYQGNDQVLQRPVAIKVVSAQYAAAYRAAIRLTSQFSHPNIVGIYDLIVELDALYVIQEYIEGENFAALLQAQLSTYEVIDLGIQVCQGLLYAGSSSRKVCHGDLTPSSVLHDRNNMVRVNNFALPPDQAYFSLWSSVGGDGNGIADEQLPWGQQTPERQADDVRALGLLLYQLLAGRQAGAVSVEPPVDGRLRFARNTPPELCELVARAIIRQHPQNIGTVDVLYTELKALSEQFAPIFAPTEIYPPDGRSVSRPLPPPGTGKLVSTLPARDTTAAQAGATTYRADTNMRITAMDAVPASSPVADAPLKLATPLLPDYTEMQAPRRRVNLPTLLLLGLLVFSLFFAAGYFIATTVFHP